MLLKILKLIQNPLVLILSLIWCKELHMATGQFCYHGDIDRLPSGRETWLEQERDKRKTYAKMKMLGFKTTFTIFFCYVYWAYILVIYHNKILQIIMLCMSEIIFYFNVNLALKHKGLCNI